MSSARERIFGAIRLGLGGAPAAPEAIAAEASALLADPQSIRPSLPNADVAEIFAARVALEKIGATVERIAAMAALPDAVRRYLASRGLGNSVALQPRPELLGLDWSGIETHQAIAPDEPASVGLADWGIAETGSLVFHSGPATPVLFHFLPLHHLVALRAETIVPYLEDYASIAANAGPPPRNVNLVTGASGTTDIEGSYVRGAHGPGFLHVILIEARLGALPASRA